MEETTESIEGLVKQVPDAFVGTYTLTLAENILYEAKQSFDDKTYDEALIKARNCIRITASAVLFKDGYVAQTLDASCSYLEKTYPGRFPVTDWKDMEDLPLSQENRIVDGFLKVIGALKDKEAKDKEKVNMALNLATDFVERAKNLFMDSEQDEIGESIVEKSSDKSN